jgi:hypothetical protein
MDFDITVDLASMSPVTEDIQRNSWNTVLQILTNQPIMMILAQSEALLRKTLSLYGIRAENEIQEIKRVLQGTVDQMAMMAAAGAAGKNGSSSSSTSPSPAGPGPPSNAMSLLTSFGRAV